MQQFTRETLEQLLTMGNEPIISIYMPTVKKGHEQQQNPIRLSNAYKQARQQLEESGLSNHQIKENLSQVKQMADDPDFWQHLKKGLAIFITADQMQLIKLPIKVNEMVMVNHHPFIKPLLPLITTNGQYFILTLSQNDVRLYQANRTDIDGVYLGEDVPLSMEEYLSDYEVHAYLSHHTSNSTPAGKSGVFHGQGGGDESFKKDLAEFLNKIENRVTDLVEGTGAPLVLVGVEFLTSMYRDLNKYKELLEDTVEGNPAQLGKPAIHEQAWKLVRPLFKEKEKKALEYYHDLSGTGKTADEPTEVVKAAFDGKVLDLFVLRDAEIWGEYDLDQRLVELHVERGATSVDLADLAVSAVIRNGGNVYSLKEHEMIENTPMAGTFRY